MRYPLPINTSAGITWRETNRDFTYGRTVLLTLSIRRPVVRLIRMDAVQERINNRIRLQAQAFYRYASRTLYRQALQEYRDSLSGEFPFRPYDAVMEYEITYNADCHLSLYYDRYQFTGGAHGSTIRASDTYSLKTGEVLPLSHFFKPGTNYQGFLITKILEQADRNMKEDPYIYFEDYRELIVKYFNPESFYLTSEGIAIYYQQYEIAPYSTGIVVFTIPYEELGWRAMC